jgi:hypothetical protein
VSVDSNSSNPHHHWEFTWLSTKGMNLDRTNIDTCIIIVIIIVVVVVVVTCENWTSLNSPSFSLRSLSLRFYLVIRHWSTMRISLIKIRKRRLNQYEHALYVEPSKHMLDVLVQMTNDLPIRFNNVSELSIVLCIRIINKSYRLLSWSMKFEQEIISSLINVSCSKENKWYRTIVNRIIKSKVISLITE